MFKCGPKKQVKENNKSLLILNIYAQKREENVLKHFVQFSHGLKTIMWL